MKLSRPLKCIATSIGLMTSLFLGSPVQSAEPTVDLPCVTNGDSLIFTSSRLWVPESRLVRFRPLERYGGTGGQRAICTVKVDPPGYRWLSCYRGVSGPYMASRSDDSRYPLPNVIEAVADPNASLGRISFSGSCKVKR
jgi:hypothetical protein